MICDECQREADHYVRKLTKTGFRTQCRACKTGRVRPSVYSPFADMRIDHVHGHDGKALRVTSLRQLYEAEKEFKFKSCVGHTDEARFDDPPQQTKDTAHDIMTRENKWLYPDVAKQMVRDMKASGEIQ
jgi:hypothetical protein